MEKYSAQVAMIDGEQAKKNEAVRLACEGSSFFEGMFRAFDVDMRVGVDSFIEWEKVRSTGLANLKEEKRWYCRALFDGRDLYTLIFLFASTKKIVALFLDQSRGICGCS